MTEKFGLNLETPDRAEFLPPDRLPGEFLKSLGPPALSDLFSIEKRLNLPANFAMYRQGEVPSQVFVLLDGKARVSFESDAGRRFISRIARPGELLGLPAVVTGQPYATTAELIFPAEVSSVQRDDFLSFFEAPPRSILGCDARDGARNRAYLCPPSNDWAFKLRARATRAIDPRVELFEPRKSAWPAAAHFDDA